MADVVSGYLSAIDDELPSIIERLRTVEIVSRPAVKVIAKWDSANTLVHRMWTDGTEFRQEKVGGVA